MRELKCTHEELVSNVLYSPDTGEFAWIGPQPIRGKRRGRLGMISGNGYLAVTIFGTLIYLHRLAWFYMTKSWPAELVDHINGNRADNRWANLRESTFSQNSANSKLSAANKSGFKGVRQNKENGKWNSFVGHKFLGTYSDIHEADEACRKYRERLYGEFANHGDR